MRIVSTSYSKTESFSSPEEWLNRIRFYTGILEALSQQHEVHSIERINFEGLLEKNGVHYHFIKLAKTVERFPLKMHQRIRQLKPDVVLVNGFIFPLQIIQLRLTLGSKPKIFVLHRAEKPFHGVKKWLQVLADRCVDGYFFASAEFGKEWLKNGNIKRAGKIHEIMQASSVFFPKEKSVAQNKLAVQGNPVYLWVGRLEKNKDPLTVVKAFILFQQTYPSARLYMIYQTEELLEELIELVKTNNASSSIMLVGEVEHLSLEDWFSAADFFVSGSHYEGSGIALVEAMSCGCIPLVTDIISFRKLAGGIGLLYPAGDIESLVEVFRQSVYIDKDTERNKALKKFKKDLSFAAIAEKINRLLFGEEL